jgi:hypothetical protein
MKRFSILAFAAVFAVPALASKAEFTCGAPAGQTCDITIFFSSGGTKNFVLKGGEKTWIHDVYKGDKWCSARNTGVPPNPSTCTRNDVANLVD